MRNENGATWKNTLFKPQGQPLQWLEDFRRLPVGTAIKGRVFVVNDGEDAILDSFPCTLHSQRSGLKIEPIRAH
jgi:hypothetical protein